jgi:hypothetical protein
VVQVAISSTGERIAHGSSRWRRSETVTPAEDGGIVDETPHCAEHDRESSHAALEGAWCAHAEERPHPEAQVERAGMHEQSLQHVFVTAHMRSPERTRLVEMRTRALEQFPTSAKQSLSTFAADPASVRIHGVSLRALIGPRLAPPIRFADIRANLQRLQIVHRGAAVVALVGNEPSRPLRHVEAEADPSRGTWSDAPA